MPILWLDGRICEAAAIDASDRGLLLGDGVFDTSLVLGGRVFRETAHRARLEAALTELGIPLAPRHAGEAMQALSAEIGAGSLRLTVTRGPGPRGLLPPAEPRPTLFGSAAPLDPAAMFRPVRLGMATARRNEHSPTSRLKALAYLDAVLETRAARAAGADEALFLNTGGALACASLANLFLLDGRRLATPPLSAGILPGVTRALVLELARDLGLDAEERAIAPEEIGRGVLLLSNSLRLLAPAALDAAPPPAPPEALALMKALCAAVAAECGVDPRRLGARTDAPAATSLSGRGINTR